MSKKTAFSILLFAVLALPLVASAQLRSYGPAVSIFYLLDKLLGALWVIFAAIAVIMFLYSGVIFLTAQGDPGKISTAKQAFLWGVIGVIVGIISYSIIAIVGSLVGA